MVDYSRIEMSIADLESTHSKYDKNIDYWDYFQAAYKGTRQLVENNYAIIQHERESSKNHTKRQTEAYGFNYSGSIIDLFSFYLSKETAVRDMGPLANDKQWSKFNDDCNLYGDNFDNWLIDAQKWASVLGHVGILIDKSSITYATVEEELKQNVYPYVARYFPQNILDWEFARDQNNRPYLSKLKLKDSDGTYRIWTTKWWATYKADIDSGESGTIMNITTGKPVGGKAATSDNNKDMMIKSESSGDNPFIDPSTGRGEIPFVWLYNIRGEEYPLGISDIKDIADIDVSIINNLSESEEVITYGAFPMLLKPMRADGIGPEGRGNLDVTGPTAILEFDPEHPESKPEWLASQVVEPIRAILELIGLKASEIYRISNAGGMAATEIQTQAKSGVALKSEFQLLNGKLVNKGKNAEEAERSIKKYWCMWQKRDEAIEDISVEWPETYDIENLAQDLENAVVAKTFIKSRLFYATLQKKLSKSLLPNTNAIILKEIDAEIDQALESGELDIGNIPDERTIVEGETVGQQVPIPVKRKGGSVQPAEDGNTDNPPTSNQVESSNQ